MEESSTGLTLDLAELRRLKDDIGAMPPRPPTTRGRAGAMMVGIVRRALFWVWPPIHAFLDALCRMLERLARILMEIDEKVRSFDSHQDLSDRIAIELAETRTHRDHMDQVQAELWMEITKLRAQVAEIRAAGIERSSARSS